jgi:hypothetical protein
MMSTLHKTLLPFGVFEAGVPGSLHSPSAAPKHVCCWSLSGVKQ